MEIYVCDNCENESVPAARGIYKDGDMCECGGTYKPLTTDSTDESEVPCSDWLASCACGSHDVTEGWYSDNGKKYAYHFKCETCEKRTGNFDTLEQAEKQWRKIAAC